MRILWRTLVMLALVFWLGGFTFYSAVVIPTGARVLGGHSVQSEVTRQLVPVAHLAGAVALLLLLLDNLRRGWVRVGLVLAALLALAAQVVLAGRIEAVADRLPDEYPAFYQWHRAYLLVSTGQWLVAVALVPLLLHAWRTEDRAAPAQDSHPGFPVLPK